MIGHQSGKMGLGNQGRFCRITSGHIRSHQYAPGDMILAIHSELYLSCMSSILGNSRSKNPDFLQIRGQLLMHWELSAIVVR